MKKWLLAALVCTLAVTGCSKYKQVSDLPETDETTETESMSGETTEETLEVQQETEPAEPQKERVRVKGVYISGYMAGYAAVKLGYKHLGFLGGMSVPAVTRFGYGYVQGVDEAAKELGITSDVELEYVCGGQFYGDADITAYMDTWYGSKGVEVVFACGGGIYTSAAEAAAKVDGKVIGVDSDQSGIIGEDITVTSAMKGLAPTVKTALDAIKDGNWESDYAGKIDNLGLVSENPEDNYVQLPMETTQWDDNFTVDDYKDLVKKLYNGEIEVSSDITAMPKTEITVNDYGSIK